MYKDINDYMLLQKEDRQLHVNLDDPCIEIGGHSSSCKAMLAHFLKTTIPSGKKVHVCHSCGNSKCTNVLHLYWGTPKENLEDSVKHGTHASIFERTRRKYGEERHKEMMKITSSKAGKHNNRANAYTEEELNAGRNIIKSCQQKRGWIQDCAKVMGVSHTQVRRFIKKYASDLVEDQQ